MSDEYRERVIKYLKESERDFPGSTRGIKVSQSDSDAALHYKAKQAEACAHNILAKEKQREVQSMMNGAKSVEIGQNAAVIETHYGSKIVVSTSQMSGITIPHYVKTTQKP